MKSNKGFSLIELIVVVAIMSVLVGILAPAYISYVEKTRITRDDSNADTIKHTVELVVLSGGYQVEDEILVSFDSDGIQVASGTDVTQPLTEELEKAFGDLSSVVPASKKYADLTYEISIIRVGEDQYDINTVWSE